MELISSVLLDDALSKLSPTEYNQISEGLEWLSKNRVLNNLIMIGGCSVATYCSNRALTPDFDFVVQPHDFHKIVELLEYEGMEYKPLVTNELIGYQIPDFNIDFIINSVERKESLNFAFRFYNKMDLNSFEVKVIMPELLLTIKLLLGREKDLDDAFRIIASNVVAQDKYNQLIDLIYKNTRNQEFEILHSYSSLLK